MKHLFFLLVVLSFCCSSCGLSSKSQKQVYRVTTSGRRVDCPIVVRDIPTWAKSAVVSCGGHEISSQLDKPLNELVFVAAVNGTKVFEVTFSSKSSGRAYPSRVHAQMWLKNPDNSLAAVDTLCSERDDMSQRLDHHGPAFESEYAAYRIFFDEKQTIDTYGKKTAQLELARTMWNTSDEQLRSGFGYDNLRVLNSVGLGALKGWNAQKQQMVHITDIKRREACILARGPVRTVIEMRVEGWNYSGREIAMTSRYMLYAGHSDVQVQHTLEGDFKGLVFTTGIMKMAKNKLIRGNSAAAAFGSDFPGDDTLKRQRESVGLAISLPPKQVESQIDDSTNYLYQLTPDIRGRIDYTFAMLWRRSSWLDEMTDDQCLIELLSSVEQAQTPVLVARIK